LEPVSDELIIPLAIESVIQRLDAAKTPFTELDVQQALGSARKSLRDPTEEANFGAWVEVLAFALVGSRERQSPWGTYYGPRGSGTTKDGKTVYFPDIAGADARVVAHWGRRAQSVTHPVLKARYADLAWEMAVVIGQTRRDPQMARIAIDAYMASSSPAILPDLHDRFDSALRALDLAILLRDSERTGQARRAVMQLHHESVTSKQGRWWLAFDRLIQDKRAGLTDEERRELVDSLESLVAHFSDSATPQKFNPHATQDAAKRLIKHYTRVQKPDDARRLHAVIGRTFEHFAGLGNAMLASAVLQTAVNAYRDAGLAEESRRVRILMQDKIGQSRDQMVPVATEFKITKDDMEKFLAGVVVDDLGSTFVKIAVQFLPDRRELGDQVQQTLKEAPLMALLTQAIIADNRVAATVGSVEDDPFGRLVRQTTMNFGFSEVWLQQALNRAIEVHGLTPEHFVAWANRLGLFDDVTLLLEGITAWYERDIVKAVHVLVPQVELGLRGIVAKLGMPVTKAHQTVADVSVAIGMGDILYSNKELAESLGPDLTLYFLSLYADPRGKNLRNDLAHGLLKVERIRDSLVWWLVHTLLVFGIWDKLAEKRR
jgi:hypothetical protein